jgi:hypothetical protein
MANRNWMEVQSVHQLLDQSCPDPPPLTVARALTFKSQVSSLLGPLGKLVAEGAPSDLLTAWLVDSLLH